MMTSLELHVNNVIIDDNETIASEKKVEKWKNSFTRGNKKSAIKCDCEISQEIPYGTNNSLP